MSYELGVMSRDAINRVSTGVISCEVQSYF